MLDSLWPGNRGTLPGNNVEKDTEPGSVAEHLRNRLNPLAPLDKNGGFSYLQGIASHHILK